MTAAATGAALRYALITPARNEEAYIERTLRSVVDQTRIPGRWIVVSDASTDRTDAIVKRYARQHPWIELLRLEGNGKRTFAGKARAFNTGYARLRHAGYDIVGNVDADVSFDEEYFAFLLERFAEMPELGVAGTLFLEGRRHYDYRFTSIEHVSGTCQLFRRACLEELGGYALVERGGIDCIAVTTARLHGWSTRSFVEKLYVHHRAMGSAGRARWEPWFRRGEMEYAVGGHPVWQLARATYQSRFPPYVIGGFLLLAGYGYGWIRRIPRQVSTELVRFHRTEQLARLKRAAGRLLPLGTREPREAMMRNVALGESVARLERWVEAHDYKGYEPFDGLSSYVRPLTFGNRFLQQLLQQVGRQSPINLRPLLGIQPLDSTKGRGYMARGYLTALARTGRSAYRDKATACLDWLVRNPSPLYADYSWGNHFDYASRGGTYAKHESTIVWTALIGQAFLDGYESLADDRYLDVARSICRWILALPREETATGACLSYLAGRQLSIHNANLLGAALLARTARHGGGEQLVDVARAAVRYSCARQLRDGAWYYGEGKAWRWIDNFHTGYNLDSLLCYLNSTGDEWVRSHLDRGFHFFKTHFIEADGRPRYYAAGAYPTDVQCAAQSIETLVNFAGHDCDALATAERVARWTIENMQDPTGYFYYRRYPFVTARIPMLHWGQATMYRALSLMLLARAGGASRMAAAAPSDGAVAPARVGVGPD